MKNHGKLPLFKSDEEEAQFWAAHSSAKYWDEFKDAPEVVFIRPKEEVMTLRLERDLADRVRALAHRRGINCATLIRTWLKRCCTQQK